MLTNAVRAADRLQAALFDNAIESFTLTDAQIAKVTMRRMADSAP